MNVWKLILGEILFRKTGFALSVFAVTIASTLFVAGPTLIQGYSRETRAVIEIERQALDKELHRLDDETRKIMRDIGFNLRIVHRDTNMADFWASDYSTDDMPQDDVARLANAEALTLVVHLVATLQQKVKWNDRTALLVGYLPETPQPHRKKKKPMGFNIDPGTIYLGHELGIGRKEGEQVEVLGKSFKVARILGEKGYKQDVTIAMSLGAAQEVLDKKDRVNQILALGCRCAGERLPKIRAQLEAVLPETKITEIRGIAVARAEQRDLVTAQKKAIIAANERKRSDVESLMGTLDAVLTPVVVLACVIWIGLMALGNVRERRNEIGVLRALGLGTRKVAALFLGKAAIVGVLGGLIGFGGGTLLAYQVGVQALEVSTEHFSPKVALFFWTAFGAPVLTALASYLPTLAAVMQDPAEVLREE